jgi:hypothetical protein
MGKGTDDNNDSKARIKHIIQQLAGTISEKDEFELIPECVIKGTGDIFCFYPSKRMMVRITRGTKVYIVEEEVNEFGRLLVYTFNGDLIEIDPQELQHTGFD